MNYPQPPQTPQDSSNSHIPYIWHVGNVYMSPHPSQYMTTFNPPETPLARAHTSGNQQKSNGGLRSLKTILST